MTEKLRDTIFNQRADFEAKRDRGYAIWLRNERQGYFDNQANQILNILGTLERGTTFHKGVEGSLTSGKRMRLEMTLKDLVRLRIKLLPYLPKL